MKKITSKRIITILAILPIVILAVIYQRLPEQVPMNWGFDNTVVYQDKNNLWILVLTSPVLGALLMFLPKVDPRRKNYEKFQEYYDGFCIFMMLFMIVMEGIIVIETFWPGRISVPNVIIFSMGLLFIWLGNMMPKVKSNFFMGVKTPWALSDTDVWNKTNRLAGRLFFLTGIIMILTNFFLTETMKYILLTVLISVSALSPCIMSYIWYQQKHQA